MLLVFFLDTGKIKSFNNIKHPCRSTWASWSPPSSIYNYIRVCVDWCRRVTDGKCSYHFLPLWGEESVTSCLGDPSDVHQHPDTLVTLTRQVADMLIAPYERGQSLASGFSKWQFTVLQPHRPSASRSTQPHERKKMQTTSYYTSIFNHLGVIVARLLPPHRRLEIT